jgi:hypothetical protein
MSSLWKHQKAFGSMIMNAEMLVIEIERTLKLQLENMKNLGTLKERKKTDRNLRQRRERVLISCQYNFDRKTFIAYGAWPGPNQKPSFGKAKR